MSTTMLQLGGWAVVLLLLGLGTETGRAVSVWVISLAFWALLLYGLVAFVHMAWRMT